MIDKLPDSEVKFGFLKIELARLLLTAYAVFLLILTFILPPSLLWIGVVIFVLLSSFSYGLSGGLLSFLLGALLLAGAAYTTLNSSRELLLDLPGLGIMLSLLLFLAGGMGTGVNIIKEQKLRSDALFENTTSAAAMLDRDHRVLDINDEFEETFGYSLDEIRGEDLDDVLERGSVGSADREKTDAVMAGRRVEFEATRYDRRGRARRFSVRGIPIRVKGKVKGIYAVYDDITERRQRQKQLQLTKFSIDNASLAIFWIKPDGELEFVNDTACKMLGYRREELLDMRFSEIDAGLKPAGRQERWKQLKQERSRTLESEFETSSGRKYPVEITGHYLRFEEAEYEFVYARDISEQREREKKINYLLYHDQLTGLYNHRFFQEEMERLDTPRQLPLSLIMLDVNGLKLINDSYGHSKGDELLQKTARVLRDSVRSEDIIARWGGDEFVILLPSTPRSEARRIYDRIRKRCEDTVDDELPISLGMGIGVKKRPEEDMDDILQKADENMYQDKLSESRSVKNRIVGSLLNTLETKSNETEEHTARMAELARKMGQEMELSRVQIKKLSLLSTLHDIGKATVSEDILNKSGELRAEEWDMIKEHPEKGYRIASATEEFSPVAGEILAHHERWDGCGYPRGLQGEEIPLLARIIAVIDAYDVMVHERSYSPSLDKKTALEEIRRCAGGQFDPRIVEAFMDVIDGEKQ